ncbi:DUF2637 domain-containing protein [Streptomyces sp. OfavH-34-F]|uniref:DUF2637 domain-containing protein n=1 Tax=Streptomyces sp. OfavH-34-F TaxID=2917760 RepID=UPI001EF2AFD5|nr:DUF2637 domain-containing protein [Streptomyces sp. OfavH-34-F]MCG7524044.1 DUF2637 domain-containing protein [Streptomyces sp. OfavH-34-F]
MTTVTLDPFQGTTPTVTELLTSWQFVAGAVVLTLGPALALRRRRAIHAALDEQQRSAALELRGRRVEDCLTLVIAAAAAALSATGLRRVGRHQMGLADPFDLLPFIALDIAAMVCGRRARRRARTGQGPGLSGILFWVLAGTSSLFSAAEAASPLGAAVRAVWPVLAAVLWELGSLEERRAARSNRTRPDRRLALIRLFHPVEAVRVALLLAARQELTQEEATAEVRISRAAYRWYRLRRAQEAVRKSGRTTRWAFRLLEARADGRAQNASERARCADPAVLEQVVGRLQLRVRQTEWAGMNLRSAAAFEALRGTLIGFSAAVPTRAGSAHTAPSTSAGASGNPQVEASTGSADSTRDVLTDAEVEERIVRLVPRRRDGKLAWGINKCARVVGIGTPRARKFHTSQSEWLPAAVARHSSTAPPAPTGPTGPPSLEKHVDQALALANADTGPPAEPDPRDQPLGSVPPAGPDDEPKRTGPAGDYQPLPGSRLLVPVGAGRR